MLTAHGLIADTMDTMDTMESDAEFPNFGSSWALVMELIFEKGDDDIAMVVHVFFYKYIQSKSRLQNWIPIVEVGTMLYSPP